MGTNVIRMISSGLTVLISTMQMLPGKALKGTGVTVGALDIEGAETGAAIGTGPGDITNGCIYS
jgi:hypothetical protein